jgi:hypothetical protein
MVVDAQSGRGTLFKITFPSRATDAQRDVAP